jgi:hypothetical protein
MCPPRRPIMSNHARKRATRARSIKGPGEGASAAQLTLAPRMLGYCLTHTWTMPAKASRTAGRQNQTQAHGGSLGNLVRLEFRPLCRDPHVARCTPVPGARRALLGGKGSGLTNLRTWAV